MKENGRIYRQNTTETKVFFIPAQKNVYLEMIIPARRCMQRLDDQEVSLKKILHQTLLWEIRSEEKNAKHWKVRLHNPTPSLPLLSSA
jgi:hypothetical protein